MIQLFKGDCLIESDKIDSGSVDLILTDLPYGTMTNIDKEFVGYGRKNGDGHVWDNVIDTNRSFIGIEMDDKYFEIAKNRIQNVRTPNKNQANNRKPI